MAFSETRAAGSQQMNPPPRWLLLTDFASKYRVSVSTLRRRIKTGSQAYRFEGGRYYLPDQMDFDIASENASHTSQKIAPTVSSDVSPKLAAESGDEPLITTTSKLLNELKQAYTLILHEKEEQIVYLKEEIADLKTLVRVLESENARLSSDLERDRREQPKVSSAMDRTAPKNPFGTA